MPIRVVYTKLVTVIYCQKQVLFLPLLLICYALIAQKTFDPPLKRCPVKTINFEQGLINISITSAITDAMGFTWFSTKTGLERYNGYKLVTVDPVAEGDTIHINYPVFFLAGKNNSFLIGYKKGILEFNTATNSFRKIITIETGINLHYSLIPFIENGDGIWCLEENKGIVIYNHKDIISNRFPAFSAISADSILRSDDLFQNNKIIAVNNDFIFIRASVESILQINIKTRALQYFNYPGTKLCGLDCNDENLFIASRDAISCIRIKDHVLLHTFLFKQIIASTFNISTLELMGRDRLLVCADRRLFEFDTSCNCRREITTINSERIVNTGEIPFVYQDAFNRIWALTLNEIKRIENVEIPFQHIVYAKEKNNFVRCICIDEEQHLLLAGCFNGGILLFDSLGKPLWQKPLITQKVKDITSIEKFTGNKYLIVTLKSGLFFLNPFTRQLTPVPSSASVNNDLLMQEHAYSNSLLRINDSTILISTRYNVFRCIFRNDKLVSVTGILNTKLIYNYPLTCCMYTAAKVLWTGSETGELLRLNDSGAMKTIKVPGNYTIRCLAEDAQQAIWVGTEKGLFIYSSAGRLLKQITRESGLLNDFIYALQSNDNGNHFYASTNMGLSSIAAGGNIMNYTRELGLQENEFNTQSSAKTTDGKLFFGGINGITAFYPNALSGIKDSCIINITRLAVNDSLYNSFAGPWKGDSLRLDYNHNHIQLDIAATGLLNPNEYNYQYRLKSFDEAWQFTHQPADIRYTLPPGRYLFEIDGSPILSSNSVFHKKLVIIISPPWWQTWWFRIIGFAVVVGLIIWLTLRYNRNKYSKKLQAMKLQNEIQDERERISKELHDNIGTQVSYISSNLDWILHAPVALGSENEKHRLSAVNKIAKEVISDLRETIWAIKKESVHLDELADRLKLYIRTQTGLYPAIDFRVNESIQSDICFSPTNALNIFRIFQEATSNILKHANATELKLTIQSVRNDSFSLTIEDNGCGFVQAAAVKDHYGLENMRSRANDMGAVLLITSGKNSGTRITLSIE